MYRRLGVPLVPALALLAGCGGGSDDAGDKEAKPVAGTFAGKVPKTDAFVSVAAAPVTKGQAGRDVTVFVCDAKRLCEWFSGSANGNDFVARSDARGDEAKGKLTDKAVSGTIKLSGGKTLRYSAKQATATSGLYDLKVASNGKLSGASEAGVGVTGESTLPEPGTGTLKLADGRRLEFAATKSSSKTTPRLGKGQARVVILADGELAGVATNPKGADGAQAAFFLRSAAN
jgi:hypothetical protein